MARGSDGLRLTLNLEVRQAVNMVLVTRAQMLTATRAELDRRVGRALETNPALRPGRAAICPHCVQPRTRAGCSCGPSGRAGPPAAEIAATTSAREELLGDARAVLRDVRELRALEALVASLDAQGLRGGAALDDIAQVAGVEPADVEAALRALRQVGPVGIGCLDLHDFLRAQLSRLDDDVRAAADALIVHSAVLVADGVVGVTRMCDIPRTRLEHAVEQMRERFVAPTDLGSAGPGHAAAPPDVVFRVTAHHDVEVAVLDVSVPVVDRGFVRIIDDARVPDAQRATVRAQVLEARSLVRELTERRAAIERVAMAFADAQRAYLVGRRAEPDDLTQRALARTLHVHESTISRVVHGRCVQLPNGSVTAWRSLFRHGVDVRSSLATLLADGPRRSDAALAAALGALGHPVSRRTVTKYRHQMLGR